MSEQRKAVIKLMSALAALVAIQACANEQSAHSIRTSIGIQTAKELVYEALKADVPDASIEKSEVLFPDVFLGFVATFRDETEGSPLIGYFAVNSFTGDVWNTTGECRLLTSPSIKKLQSQIKTHAKLSESEYQNLHAKRPFCGTG